MERYHYGLEKFKQKQSMVYSIPNIKYMTNKIEGSKKEKWFASISFISPTSDINDIYRWILGICMIASAYTNK